MKITICASLAFVKEIKEVSEKLKELNHEVFLPRTAELIIKGEITQEALNKEKETKDFADRIIKNDATRVHYNKIKNSDAILVLNYYKNGINNYIGGSVLIEIGFAHVLNKKIFLLNPIPEISYTNEILGVQPEVLDGDLKKIN